MTLLICNVGGNDLICATLPKERRGERAWAEEVLARYDELRNLLHLPIIGKALRYLHAQGVQIDQLILIASDQPAPATDVAERRFRESDTCATAAVMTRCIAEGVGGLPSIPAPQIRTWIIADATGCGGDPSDYDLVLGFLEHQLKDLAVEHVYGSAYLEVTGGTPAMTTGLLIAGTEAFGARTEVLSIHPRRETPAALGVGRRLLATPLRATLRSNASTWAYDAALRTFREHRATMLDQLRPEAEHAIEALLTYAHCRYNFDFPGARTALATLPNLPAVWDGEFVELRSAVAAPNRLALLAEVIHGATARYEIGLYADFLTQIVRFEENLLRLLCLQRGAIFVSRQSGSADDDGSLISRAWLRSLTIELPDDRDDGRDRATNRTVLRQLAGLLARIQGEDLTAFLSDIDRLRGLVYLRNESTHSLEGIRRVDLAIRFVGRETAHVTEADQILPYVTKLYAHVAGQTLPPSPYAAISGLLTRLLQPEGDSSA